MLAEDLIALVKHIQTIQSETNSIECKAAAKGCPKKLYDTLSSFSNQNGGGTIIFGINEENGFSADGVYDAADLQKKVSAQCLQMQPAVRALFTVCSMNDAIIVSAEIPEIDISDKPCYYTGKGRLTGSYIRVGDSDEPMTEYEIYSYEAFRNKYQDDIRTIERAATNELDKNQTAQYLINLRKKKNRFSQMTEADILRLSGITSGSKLTLAGTLVFAVYPQAYFPRLCITAIAVPGLEIGDVNAENIRFIDNARIDGTIPQMLDEACTFVYRNMAVKTKIDPSTGKRQDTEEYPMEAVREIIINALVHRDYSIHTEGMPIQLVMYKNRIEVTNPGGLYGRIKIDQLGKIQPDTRNPVLSTILEDMGITENRYSGVPTIHRVLKEADMPEAKFEDIRGSFRVTIFKRVENNTKNQLLSFCRTPKSRHEISEFLGIGNSYYSFNNVVKPLLDSGELMLTIPEKSRSKYQKYVSV
ncbi:MAG: ATP-binding protein [Candidatus Ornithomonoglobus sp.]